MTNGPAKFARPFAFVKAQERLRNSRWMARSLGLLPAVAARLDGAARFALGFASTRRLAARAALVARVGEQLLQPSAEMRMAAAARITARTAGGRAAAG